MPGIVPAGPPWWGLFALKFVPKNIPGNRCCLPCRAGRAEGLCGTVGTNSSFSSAFHGENLGAFEGLGAEHVQLQ